MKGGPKNLRLYFSNKDKKFIKLSVERGDFYGISIGSDKFEVIEDILGKSDDYEKVYVKEIDGSLMHYVLDGGLLYFCIEIDDTIRLFSFVPGNYKSKSDIVSPY